MCFCVLGLQKYRRGYAKRVAWPDAGVMHERFILSLIDTLGLPLSNHDHVDLWWLRLCLLRQYEPLESARGQDAVDQHKHSIVMVVFRRPVFEQPEWPSRIRESHGWQRHH